MSTRLSITIGIYPPGLGPKWVTRGITLTDLTDTFNTFATMMTSPPISSYIPAPPVDPPVDPPIEE